MRKTILAANWKMNLTKDEAEALISNIEFINTDQLSTMIFPPSIYLTDFNHDYQNITTIGVQNISNHEQGAFTGELSAKMVKSNGISTTLVGHSERRNIFRESNELTNQKIKQALAHDMTIVFCIGETLEERESDATFDILAQQLDDGLKGVSDDDFRNILIAYEPVWAIGTGKTATPEIAQEAHAYIRKHLSNKIKFSEEIIILYGGSVKSSNIVDLIQQQDIDGALIGGASLKSEEFNSIIELAAEAIG
jgi:triosephosphate isomerase